MTQSIPEATLPQRLTERDALIISAYPSVKHLNAAIRRGDFPPPDQQDRSVGPLWWNSTIKAWAAAHGWKDPHPSASRREIEVEATQRVLMDRFSR
ncbi:hypothetical protein [Geminicoccus roseus]|uniref:hypothetical protein n=1 Tax=Geminicoccus roseus TaxID=404900 RepID=UPI0012F9A065|nr:hypothetical protein [Geminicoccus roseus]